MKLMLSLSYCVAFAFAAVRKWANHPGNLGSPDRAGASSPDLC